MSTEDGGLFLILAASQIPILIMLGGALRRRDLTRPARQLIRFWVVALGVSILSNLILWLSRLSPTPVLRDSVRQVLIVVMAVLIFVLLLGTLVTILLGAFRPADSASSRSDR